MPVAQDRHQRGAVAIDAHHVDLRQITAAHLGHILHQHHGPARRPDRQLVHLRDRQRAAVQANVVFAVAHLDRSGRQDQVLERNCAGDVGWRQMLGIKLAGDEIDHDLGLFAAVRQGNGRALHGRQLCSDVIQTVIEELLLA